MSGNRKNVKTGKASKTAEILENHQTLQLAGLDILNTGKGKLWTQILVA